MTEGAEDRYLLICRHARHLDGHLLPVKNSLEQWEYPTDSVGRVLAEELALRARGVRLGTMMWADTKESTQTAALLLNRLASKPSPKRPTSPPERLEVRLPSLLAGEKGRQRGKITWPSHLPTPVAGYDSEVQCGVAPELSPAASDQVTENLTQPGGLIFTAFDQMPGPANALLLVGHQPQLGRLTADLTRPRFGRGKALPLSSSEILCLRHHGRRTSDGWIAEGRWKLLWAITPDDSGPLAELAGKVKGKMESAKLLSAIITLALTALLGTLLDTTRWNGLRARQADLPGLAPYNAQLGATLAFVLLLTALAVYLVTMYAYDRLLMPVRFWGESSGDSQRRRPGRIPRRSHRIPRRPPSSAAWVIYRNMQLIWFALFTPANVLVALALAALAAPLLGVTENRWWLAVVALGLVALAWSWWWRPVLGSED